ncbi:proteoglycan 4-like [Dorcoceras hygrometricum]|uniref:Proteoglycan 4-like n=1 Tax=Dorcoceras hygrometricum TaxID=472368 RepID=A0A2Z7AX46_9LAMI|nr:proteoglycan 4-like [Dorcoceras hygrometricum]
MQQLRATSGAHQQRLATNRRNGSRTPAALSRGALVRPSSETCASMCAIVRPASDEVPPIVLDTIARVARPARDMRSPIARPALNLLADLMTSCFLLRYAIADRKGNGTVLVNACGRDLLPAIDVQAFSVLSSDLLTCAKLRRLI